MYWYLSSNNKITFEKKKREKKKAIESIGVG